MGRNEKIFTPFLQSKTTSSATLLVKTFGDPLRIAADIVAVDAKVPQFDVITMDKQVENSLTQEHLVAILASAFGTLALGTDRGRILGLILGETARLLAIGIAVDWHRGDDPGDRSAARGAIAGAARIQRRTGGRFAARVSY